MDLVTLDNMLLAYDDRRPNPEQLTLIIELAKKLGSMKHLKAACAELERTSPGGNTAHGERI